MVKFLFFSLLSCDGLELFVYFFSAGLFLSEIYLKNDEDFFFLQNFLVGAFKPACNVSITFSDEKNRKKVVFFFNV